MKNKNIKYVCLVNSVYSLLIYVLRFGKEQYETTFFFVSDAISETVRLSMNNYKFLSTTSFYKKSRFVRTIIIFLLYRLSYLFWPFLKRCPLYGADHLWFSSPLIKRRKIQVIEDGLANYNIDVKDRDKDLLMSLRTFIYGSLYTSFPFGYSMQVDKIILTGFAKVPDIIKEKIELIDLNNLWHNSSNKEYIMNIFGIDEEDMLLIRTKKIIILTQPYSAIIGESELVSIYKKVITKYNNNDIIIKTHPRDNLDYRTFFPEIDVFEKKIPMELINLLGDSFTDAYTINSTAIYSFRKEVRKHILGLECHPMLLKYYDLETELKLLK